MFVCGGENIYPIEVESLLLRHPEVGEACVVPVPYGDKGEAPVAMVSLRKGEHADEAELKRHCLALGPGLRPSATRRHRRRAAALGRPQDRPRPDRPAHARALRRPRLNQPEPTTLQHVSGIDHCVLLVRDLDAAERAMARLGFRPTPRGYHSAHMGTANATVVFRDGTYFETLGVVAETAYNEATRAELAQREGLYGIALKTDDARGAAAEFAAAGLGPPEAVDFVRPVELPGGPQDAAFTVARTHPNTFPAAWILRLPAAHAGGRLA